MSNRTWQAELRRYQGMNFTEKLIWLSQLLHLVSMFARGTYEYGTDGVTNPSELRRFNELIHRIATFQKHVASSDVDGPPDDALFSLLERELQRLNISADEVIIRLP